MASILAKCEWALHPCRSDLQIAIVPVCLPGHDRPVTGQVLPCLSAAARRSSLRTLRAGLRAMRPSCGPPPLVSVLTWIMDGRRRLVNVGALSTVSRTASAGVMRERIIEMLAYPRLFVFNLIQRDGCPHGARYHGEDRICQSCDHGPQCAWLGDHNEFISLAQRSAEEPNTETSPKSRRFDSLECEFLCSPSTSCLVRLPLREAGR